MQITCVCVCVCVVEIGMSVGGVGPYCFMHIWYSRNFNCIGKIFYSTEYLCNNVKVTGLDEIFVGRKFTAII